MCVYTILRLGKDQIIFFTLRYKTLEFIDNALSFYHDHGFNILMTSSCVKCFVVTLQAQKNSVNSCTILHL